MRDDVHFEIVRLDRIAKRARAHRTRGEASGDFVLEMRAARLEAAAEARLDATVCGDASADDLDYGDRDYRALNPAVAILRFS